MPGSDSDCEIIAVRPAKSRRVEDFGGLNLKLSGSNPFEDYAHKDKIEGWELQYEEMRHYLGTLEEMGHDHVAAKSDSFIVESDTQDMQIESWHAAKLDEVSEACMDMWIVFLNILSSLRGQVLSRNWVFNYYTEHCLSKEDEWFNFKLPTRREKAEDEEIQEEEEEQEKEEEEEEEEKADNEEKEEAREQADIEEKEEEKPAGLWVSRDNFSSEPGLTVPRMPPKSEDTTFYWRGYRFNEYANRAGDIVGLECHCKGVKNHQRCRRRIAFSKLGGREPAGTHAYTHAHTHTHTHTYTYTHTHTHTHNNLWSRSGSSRATKAGPAGGAFTIASIT